MNSPFLIVPGLGVVQECQKRGVCISGVYRKNSSFDYFMLYAVKVILFRVKSNNESSKEKSLTVSDNQASVPRTG
ncbi:hypothetical protein, partial [Phaeodactylibacter xiamenensis]|uniref:hypothetical protein n=1 Tax=Phaeodactylibacter xiamenensis TaxID=1524460 RepID=UPI0024A8DEE6